jgi:hypothetical protein
MSADPTRDRRLVDHDRFVREMRPDLDRHRLDEAHVRPAVGTLGRWDAKDRELGALDRPRVVCAEREVTPRETRSDEVLEALFEDRGLARVQEFNARRVAITTAHLVTEMG